MNTISFLTNFDLIKILQIINYIISTLMIVLYFNQFIYIVFSLFVKPKKYKETENYHTYGFIICGKNEELVIGNLINSIKQQDYPKDKIHIFVCADNCTDNTANIARNLGANVFERFDEVKKGKCYALDYTFNKIQTEYKDLNIEAYIIFDADNLVSKQFTKEINKAYDEGYLVATGFRDSKNFSKNWVSAGSSYMFYRECCQVHRVRSRFNTGTYVSGTGYVIDKSLVENGWKYDSLTEDIEFSADCASKGIKIGYAYNALFYDEQPSKLKDSMKQRLRWCKGNNQVFARYGGKLFGGMFKKFTIQKWSMFTHTIPLPAISLIWMAFHQLVGGIICATTGIPFQYYVSEVLVFVWYTFRSVMATGYIDAIILLFQTWKRNECKWYKKIFYSLMFPVFLAVYLPITVVALLKKNVTWKPIVHNDTKTIDEV